MKTRAQILADLRRQIQPWDRRKGGSAFAERIGVTDQAMRLVLGGFRPISKAMLKKLGYEPEPYFKRRRR